MFFFSSVAAIGTNATANSKLVSVCLFCCCPLLSTPLLHCQIGVVVASTELVAGIKRAMNFCWRRAAELRHSRYHGDDFARERSIINQPGRRTYVT